MPMSLIKMLCPLSKAQRAGVCFFLRKCLFLSTRSHVGILLKCCSARMHACSLAFSGSVFSVSVEYVRSTSLLGGSRCENFIVIHGAGSQISEADIYILRASSR